MAKHSLPDRVSLYWLSECTGVHHGTIKRRTSNLERDSKGKFKRTTALEAVYRGTIATVDGEFVSTPEAVRRLTLAKKEEIDLEMEIKRGLRLPLDDVRNIVGQVFLAVAATIKANRDKVLSETHINDIFAMLRDAEDELTSKNGAK